MTARTPRLSIVIPTHNRVSVLHTTLASLEDQSAPSDAYEVIVVANGCRDGTADAVRARRPAHALLVVELGAANVSSARNAGAAAAQGPLVAFLDDDVEVEAGFVAAHLAVHEGHHRDDREPIVAIGYLPGQLQPEADLFAIALRGWWEAMFDRLRDPARRRTYSDVLSGNMSLRRDVFLRAGGFDPSLRCHEDYELGFRLLQRGCRIAFAEAARGRHRDDTRLPRACARKRQEGVADVRLAERYPELRTVLPMARPRTLKWRLTQWLAFDAPLLGDLVVRLAAALALPVLERTGATMAWFRVLYAVFGYWYSRGLADTLGSRRALRQLLRGAWDDARLGGKGLQIDLVRGLEAGAALVEATRPTALTIVAGERFVGHVPFVPGAEPLRATHFAAILASGFHTPAVEALLAAGAIRVVEERADAPPPPPRPPERLSSATAR